MRRLWYFIVGHDFRHPHVVAYGIAYEKRCDCGAVEDYYR